MKIPKLTAPVGARASSISFPTGSAPLARKERITGDCRERMEENVAVSSEILKRYSKSK